MKINTLCQELFQDVYPDLLVSLAEKGNKSFKVCQFGYLLPAIVLFLLRARYGILLGPGCYFLKPSSWDAYFTQYICPESMTKFSANHSYWLPGSWLCDNILKLQNLQDLSIKDTKISLLHLARMLKTCSKITKLDFSYQHEEGFVKTLVEHPLSAPSVIGAFNRLTHLKVTTCVLDAKDFLNDPWIFIIKLLR